GPVEGASLCNDRWRFTSWRTLGPGGKEVSRELYDHESDPLEMVNLAPRAEYGEQIAIMKSLLDGGWQAARP
ncbi:MAG: hypothetical protein ACI8QZ_003583, partial [Chlamydiales bacterium]